MRACLLVDEGVAVEDHLLGVKSLIAQCNSLFWPARFPVPASPNSLFGLNRELAANPWNQWRLSG